MTPLLTRLFRWYRGRASTMKLVLSLEVPGGGVADIVGIVPWRDKVVIATRGHIWLLEYDEETIVKLQQIAHHNDPDLRYG